LQSGSVPQRWKTPFVWGLVPVFSFSFAPHSPLQSSVPARELSNPPLFSVHCYLFRTLVVGTFRFSFFTRACCFRVSSFLLSGPYFLFMSFAVPLSFCCLSLLFCVLRPPPAHFSLARCWFRPIFRHPYLIFRFETSFSPHRFRHPLNVIFLLVHSLLAVCSRSGDAFAVSDVACDSYWFFLYDSRLLRFIPLSVIRYFSSTPLL